MNERAAKEFDGIVARLSTFDPLELFIHVERVCLVSDEFKGIDQIKVRQSLAYIRSVLFAGFDPPRLWRKTEIGKCFTAAENYLGVGLITRAEAAKMLGVSRSAITQRVQRGTLASFEFAGRKMVRREEILAEVNYGKQA